MHLFVLPSHLKAAIVVFVDKLSSTKEPKTLSEPGTWDQFLKLERRPSYVARQL